MGKKKTQDVSQKEFLDRVSDYLESNTAGAITAKILLATIAVGGIVCAGAVAPNLFRALHTARRSASEPRGAINKKSALATFSRIKRDGYVCLEERKDGKILVRLTEKGRKYVCDFSRKSIRKPIVWDRKWRVVIFDIDSKKKWARETFRRKIKEMGFLQLQKSVWAHPYVCEDEVLFLAKQLEIVESIEIFTVQKMIHEKELKKRFFSK